ncbi:MAG TPA: hypothetical protein VHW05_12610 [Phenylobacterium sp.]|jgi:hypothetical protein|nr:hypothetical protein [Phenylobacterium sp.]
MLNAVFAATALLLQAAPTAAPVITPASAPVAAQAPISPVTVQGQKKSVVEDNKIICRKEQVLGTLFPREVCARKSEIEERRRVDQAELQRGTALHPYDSFSGLPPLP